MLSEYICRIAINFMPQLNRVAKLPFWERIGGFTELSNVKDSEWEELCLEYGIRAQQADRDSAIKRAINEASLMEKYGISLLSFDDYNYPQLLLECPDAPLFLYYKGTLFHEQNALAIVGTRAASEGCKEIIREIVGEVSQRENPPIIVSGLAYGIDICAQRAAIECNLRTYAVVANGLGTIYPAANRDVANQIINKGIGAILSEYPCNSLTQKNYFLERNRIIAGISNWLLVGESGLKGGSMVTAKIAFSYGREIMAIPGSPLTPNAQGCNQLIKHNMAALVENGNDVAEFIGLESKRSTPQGKFPFYEAIGQEESAILDILKRNREGINIDELSRITNISIGTLTGIVLKMEISSLIYALPGGKYRICK